MTDMNRGDLLERDLEIYREVRDQAMEKVNPDKLPIDGYVIIAYVDGREIFGAEYPDKTVNRKALVRRLRYLISQCTKAAPRVKVA